MDNSALEPFARMVLNSIDPDEALRDEILNPKPLRDIQHQKPLQEFAARIALARERGEKVLVAGDYDCDGMMSTAIMSQGLRKYGLQTGFYIPDRLKEGYGLSSKTVEMARQKGYSLIVTVDNGIAAKNALQTARDEGISVIVTDHHLLQETPDCDVLVHPQLLDKPFHTLCGAAIAFECMRALGIEEEKFLIYAAVASISDCMEVRGETRSIIQKGLEALNAHGEIHLNHFVRSYPINETEVSFQIAPRINAIGRLCDQANANTFIRFLDLDDPMQIQKYAAQVSDLNEKRKAMTHDAVSRAMLSVPVLAPVLFMEDDSFHEGIIGLVAGQLSSRFDKPAIVCTKNGDDLKCSMRAPAGFHCLQIVGGFDGFTALGGHAQAAGFTIPSDQKNAFEDYLRRASIEVREEERMKKTIRIEPVQVTWQNVQSLDRLRPFGPGFVLPQFEIDQPAIIRTFDLSEGKHRKFALPGGVQALNFNQTSMDQAASPDEIERLIGTLSISTWNGRRKADFIIDEIEYR